MSISLVEVTRGEVVECIHRGDIAVADSSGNLVCHAGDPQKYSYLRSAAKPLQAMNVHVSGAHEAFNFGGAETAVMCSSHYAEEFHLRTVRSILTKIGLTEEHILGGVVTSLNPAHALKLAWDNVELSPLFSDCSGKHAGMLAVCVHKQYDLPTYLSPDHPCQQNICRILGEICAIPVDRIDIGIDGCSAPVHAMPLLNMATGFARMANVDGLEEKFRKGAANIFHSMNSHPQMVSGTGGFCTELIRLTNGKLIGKVGAEGVYCVGVKDRDLGIAVKVENGSMAVLPPIVVSVLAQLDILDEYELQALDSFQRPQNVNDVKTVVGAVTPVFSLT